MARYNEILVGRYNRLVQKLFSMKGPASLVTIADEAMMIYPFLMGVENWYLEGWESYGANNGVAAVAANQSGIRLRNPVGSNVIIIIESYVTQGPPSGLNTMNSFSGQATADLPIALPIANSAFDVRGRPTAALIWSGHNSAPVVPALTNTNGWSSVGPLGQLELIVTRHQEIPLLPGSAIQYQAAAVNIAIGLAVRWRERFLEDSERA